MRTARRHSPFNKNLPCNARISPQPLLNKNRHFIKTAQSRRASAVPIMKGNNPAKPLVRVRKCHTVRNGIPLLCPPKRSRCFALLSPHPNRPPASDSTARAFSECCKRFTFIHPFDSAKLPLSCFNQSSPSKHSFTAPFVTKKRFALPAPNSAIKARFHRPDYAKKRPKHLSSASKSLLQSAPCSAHRKKHEKTRPFTPSNHLSFADTTKEKLVRSPSTSVILDAPFQPVATRQQTVKRKGGSNAPVQIILTALGDNRKKTKTDTLATTIKKKRAATGHPAARQQIEKTPQPDTLRPTPPLPPAPIFSPRPVSNSLRRPPFQIFCAALASLKHLPAKRVEKTFNKKLYPAAKTPDASDTKPSSNANTQQKKRERKHLSRKIHKKRKRSLQTASLLQKC